MWRGAYRRCRVFLQWTLEVCSARKTVQLLTVENIRFFRPIDELIDSARAADSAQEVGSP